MHINSDRVKESLTAIELKHIERCTQCHLERQKLMALTLSAKNMPNIEPPEQVWQRLRQRPNYNINHKRRSAKPIKQSLLSVAASMFFVAVGWLAWSNYSLQNQLEDVLLVNMMLESEISFGSNISYQQATLIDALRKLDLDLYNAKNNQEKLTVLKKRREMILQHLSAPKGDNNEFSI